jgi:hypothetical protein
MTIDLDVLLKIRAHRENRALSGVLERKRAVAQHQAARDSGAGALERANTEKSAFDEKLFRDARDNRMTAQHVRSYLAHARLMETMVEAKVQALSRAERELTRAQNCLHEARQLYRDASIARQKTAIADQRRQAYVAVLRAAASEAMLEEAAILAAATRVPGEGSA